MYITVKKLGLSDGSPVFNVILQDDGQNRIVFHTARQTDAHEFARNLTKLIDFATVDGAELCEDYQ